MFCQFFTLPCVTFGQPAAAANFAFTTCQDIFVGQQLSRIKLNFSNIVLRQKARVQILCGYPNFCHHKYKDFGLSDLNETNQSTKSSSPDSQIEFSNIVFQQKARERLPERQTRRRVNGLRRVRRPVHQQDKDKYKYKDKQRHKYKYKYKNLSMSKLL